MVEFADLISILRTHLNEWAIDVIVQNLLLIFSDGIEINEDSLIDSTSVLIANRISLKESVVSANNSGCKDDKNRGSPHDFISHSFDCGLNAGSFAGRGGIGIAKTLQDSLKCIRSSLGKMTTYVEPLFPLHSGSKGASHKKLES